MVLLLYAAGAWLVLLVGGWLRQVLILPLIFDQLLRWGVFLGAGVAAAMAWFYPAIAAPHEARKLEVGDR